MADGANNSKYSGELASYGMIVDGPDCTDDRPLACFLKLVESHVRRKRQNKKKNTNYSNNPLMFLEYLYGTVVGPYVHTPFTRHAMSH